MSFFFLKEANTWESNNTLERIVPLGQLGLMQNKTNIYKKINIYHHIFHTRSQPDYLTSHRTNIRVLLNN